MRSAGIKLDFAFALLYFRQIYLRHRLHIQDQVTLRRGIRTHRNECCSEHLN